MNMSMKTEIMMIEYYTPEQEIEVQQDMEELASYETFDGYQNASELTAIYPESCAIEYLALGLVSEAGEVAGKVKKALRDGTWDVDKVADELGDVLWYVSQLATELDIYLSDIAKMNIDKLQDRKERGVLGGSGDKR